MKVDTRDFITGTKRASDRVQYGVLALGRAAAVVAESYAKSNARWQNRTGNARATLTGEAEFTRGTDEVTVALSHQMYYGEYLETRKDFGGKYKILEESLEKVQEEYAGGVMKLLND